MTSTTRLGLIRSVCEQPGEDTVRLALADQLAEDGDELDRAWAEAFRLRVAGKLASNGAPRTDQHKQLAVWTERLWVEATGLLSPQTLGVTLYVHRGLPYAVRLPWELYDGHRDKLFGLPLVRVYVGDAWAGPCGYGHQHAVPIAREGEPYGVIPGATVRPFLYPYELGRYLDGHTNPRTCKRPSRGVHYYNYKHPGAAEVSLNLALVRYGRVAAGLPAEFTRYDTPVPPTWGLAKEYTVPDLFRAVGARPVGTLDG